MMYLITELQQGSLCDKWRNFF